MSSASTPLRQPAPEPEAAVCEWTDEELNALTDEADAEGGEPLEAEAVIANLRAKVRQRAAASL